MKLTELIANGTVTIEDLANAPELIERAKFVKEGLEACRKTLVFPIGVLEQPCYDYTDRAGEYSSWGSVTNNGIFTCWCNWGGNHEIGKLNLNHDEEVFLAFDNTELACDLKRFLNEQIEKAKSV